MSSYIKGWDIRTRCNQIYSGGFRIYYTIFSYIKDGNTFEQGILSNTKRCEALNNLLGLPIQEWRKVSGIDTLFKLRLEFRNTIISILEHSYEIGGTKYHVWKEMISKIDNTDLTKVNDDRERTRVILDLLKDIEALLSMKRLESVLKKGVWRINGSKRGK